jgi:hypothetical protein
MNKTTIDKGKYKVVHNVDFDQSNVVSAFCDVCESMIRSQSDEDSMRKFKCCFHCAIDFAYPNKKEWDLGWRPSPDDVALSLSKRPNMSISISFDNI